MDGIVIACWIILAGLAFVLNWPEEFWLPAEVVMATERSPFLGLLRRRVKIDPTADYLEFGSEA